MSAETIPSQETAKQDAAGLLKNIHELLEAAKNPDKASEVAKQVMATFSMEIIPEEFSDDETETKSDSTRPRPAKRKRTEAEERMHASSAAIWDKEDKRLQEELKTREGQGEGAYEQLEEFPICWVNRLSRYVHGTRVEAEACAAALIQSQATKKKHVVLPRPFGHFVNKETIAKAIVDTQKMLDTLKRIEAEMS